MQCRESCGACCTAPSILQAFYGMPQGKPAGVACVHLGEDLRCALFDDPRRPALCVAFMPEPSICGDDRAAAMSILQRLEVQTLPGHGASKGEIAL